MKESTLIIILGIAGFVGYLLYKSGVFSSVATATGDKYVQYAQAMQGLANNATNNTIGLHNALTNSVNSSINNLGQWVQQGYENARRKDNEEFAQWQAIMQSY